MLALREKHQRGHTRIDWLDSYHTFSFGDYHDPQNMGFSDLRVINDDIVQPASGFGTHPHRDMEIVTYVLSGTLEHQDSMGNGSRIQPGDVQRMSAGTGITHSEFNPSATEPVHLLQIWLFPERKGLIPSYEQRRFSEEEKRGRFRLIASPDGRDGSVVIHQNAAIYAAVLGNGESVEYTASENREVWIHIARGTITLNGTRMEAGDGMGISGGEKIHLTGAENHSEVLLFDLRA